MDIMDTCRRRGLGALSRALLLALLLAGPALAQRPRPPRAEPGARAEARREARAAVQERRDEVVQFIRETFPEKARMMEKLRRRDPAEFQRRRQQLAEEVKRLLVLRDENPELFKVQVDEMRLRDELGRLAREARREKEGSRERQEAEKKLKEAVGRSFDLRQRIKEAELEDLRARLKELESTLERRAGRRAQMVEERSRDLLQNAGDDW
jgi:hypothetical protein